MEVWVFVIIRHIESIMPLVDSLALTLQDKMVMFDVYGSEMTSLIPPLDQPSWNSLFSQDVRIKHKSTQNYSKSIMEY